MYVLYCLFINCMFGSRRSTTANWISLLMTTSANSYFLSIPRDLLDASSRGGIWIVMNTLASLMDTD